MYGNLFIDDKTIADTVFTLGENEAYLTYHDVPNFYSSLVGNYNFLCFIEKGSESFVLKLHDIEISKLDEVKIRNTENYLIQFLISYKRMEHHRWYHTECFL